MKNWLKKKNELLLTTNYNGQRISGCLFNQDLYFPQYFLNKDISTLAWEIKNKTNALNITSYAII